MNESLGRARGITAVYGGQVGSEGKGAIVGYLARRYNYAAAACTFMTNAGHTWMDDDEKIVVQQLPVGIVSPDIEHIVIGPGSAITLSQLEKEFRLYDEKYDVTRRLRIHPRAVIIDEIHKQIEGEVTKRVGSTMKGCGAALADKALRHPRVRLAQDIPYLKEFLTDTSVLLNNLIQDGRGILVEGSQGFDLDINHGIQYPNCTSRQTTPQQVVADLGLDMRDVVRNVAVTRSYPIRVGNIVEAGIEVGNSGVFGGKELTWEEVTERSGYPTPLSEVTTVTQRVRRVFEIDFARLGYMDLLTKPTDYALTFADYIDYAMAGIRGSLDSGLRNFPKLTQFINQITQATSYGSVTMVKTGADDADMIHALSPSWAS
jgi:adenylosuccinate synthase